MKNKIEIPKEKLDELYDLYHRAFIYWVKQNTEYKDLKFKELTFQDITSSYTSIHYQIIIQEKEKKN